MPEPFALVTNDPSFDPLAPVSVNGFLFLPADAQAAKRGGRVPPRKVARRKAFERARRSSVEMDDG